SSFDPASFASSTAWRTASVAVSEPSVPTTMRSNKRAAFVSSPGEADGLGWRASYPARPSLQSSLTSPITIEAKRQQTRIAMVIVQPRGTVARRLRRPHGDRRDRHRPDRRRSARDDADPRAPDLPRRGGGCLVAARGLRG